MKLKRLSPNAFDRLAKLTRLQPAAVALARAVLVDGKSRVVVAKDAGFTRARVQLAVAAIERKYLEGVDVGGTPITVQLTLPPSLARALSTLSEALAGVHQDIAELCAANVEAAVAAELAKLK
ncbi:MAG: hypothetical protein FD131_3146 [Rhodocyclaceae bacterium]|nr:MAG: hypothetical protein FD131_3146 [Rhodocyclaceae bacterium]